MAKRRPSGDGMVRKREDGRWEGRIVIGHKSNGDSIFRYIYADIRGIHTTLHAALDKAVEEKLIFRNPADSCKLPPVKGREMKVLTPEEIQRLLIQAREDGCYELLLLELATGLRRGEILALQWGDLNFKTGALRVERQVHRVKGELVVSPPKTKAGNRTVLLPAPVLKVLKAYHAPACPPNTQNRLASGLP